MHAGLKEFIFCHDTPVIITVTLLLALLVIVLYCFKIITKQATIRFVFFFFCFPEHSGNVFLLALGTFLEDLFGCCIVCSERFCFWLFIMLELVENFFVLT